MNNRSARSRPFLSWRSAAQFFLAGLLGCALPPAASAADASPPADPLAWPAADQTMRPWTRWWWLGSAVDQPNLRRLLSAYQQAGIGGVEICPIYGAKGYESRFIDYLSPQWMRMFAFTTGEAHRLGLGVDLTTGTGWPFGGPWVTPAIASSGVILQRYDVAGGAGLTEGLPRGILRCLMAVGSDGRQIDLTARVRDGRLDWTAPAGAWRLYAVVQRGTGQQVKRAAPGGQGNVLDPLSPAAMSAYLARFDAAFKDYRGPPPRAEFHDSYEYFGATWTNGFFAEFQKRRGYDLRAQLPAFFGDGPADRADRVKSDYRETIAELHQAYIARWTEWSHAHGSLTREQAHGSPTNIEDVYATADIPETEIFGPVVDRQFPMLSFASSAAHVTGRTLASSETFTWLGEHFQVSLADLKPAIDFVFLSGINHMFFHGIPYSPADAPWPGWLFYAAVNFGPNGGLWHDLPAFNAYVTRCQSILQNGEPANDLLLYFPVFDFWQKPDDGLVIQFSTPGEWMWGSPFHDTAMALWDHGYSYDEVTDHFLAATTASGGGLRLGGHAYRAVLVPPARLMPVATLRHLVELARAGATILVQGSLPADVPGFDRLAERRKEFHALIDSLDFQSVAGTEVRAARVGAGRFLTGADLTALLRAARVPREPMADAGLHCIRRVRDGGYDYFIVNHGAQPVDGWVTLGTPARSAVLLDPMFANRAGTAALRQAGGAAQVYLQLRPGESRILRTFATREFSGRPWAYAERSGGAPQILAGDWQVHFLQGGPVLPRDYATATLASWTTRDDPEAKRFAGAARYTLAFDFHPDTAADWLLDLGRVCDSARVTLNGHDITTLWCPPFAVRVGPFLRPGRNVLEIDVTNVAANRIADLDRRHVNWKSFYEINFVNKDYRPFDASHWPLRDSGLLGPVTLVPLKILTPASPARP